MATFDVLDSGKFSLLKIVKYQQVRSLWPFNRSQTPHTVFPGSLTRASALITQAPLDASKREDYVVKSTFETCESVEKVLRDLGDGQFLDKAAALQHDTLKKRVAGETPQTAATPQMEIPVAFEVWAHIVWKIIGKI